MMRRAPQTLLLASALLGSVLMIWSAALNLNPKQATRSSQGTTDRTIETSQTTLQTRLTQHPNDLPLALLIADLKRQAGDLEGALRDLDQLLQLHPNHVDLLQLRVLVDLQQEDTEKTRALLSQRFQEAPRGERMDLGLLLADLNRLTNQRDQAADLYRALAQESPSSPRPLIALAMLRREQGRVFDVQELLLDARQRRGRNDLNDSFIDTIAVRWGLEAARTLTNQPRDVQGS